MRKIPNLFAAYAFGFVFCGVIYATEAKAQAEPGVILPLNENRQPAGCGSWLHARQHRTPHVLAYENWVGGFLSGTAVAKKSGYLSGKGDTTGIYLWLDNFCRANPLERLDAATSVLAEELMETHHRRNPTPPPPSSALPDSNLPRLIGPPFDPNSYPPRINAPPFTAPPPTSRSRQ